MALLKCTIEKNGNRLIWHYDNINNFVYDENWNVQGVPVDSKQALEISNTPYTPAYKPDDNPNKQKTKLTKLAIILGGACNFHCAYCSAQAYGKNGYHGRPEDVEPFMKKLREKITETPQVIDFWGGEPLLYWPTIKLLIPELRKTYRQCGIVLRTNGSLLTDEMIDLFDKYKITCSISDDLDNTARGLAAIENSTSRIDDYNRWGKILGRRMNICSVSTPANCDAIEQYNTFNKRYPGIARIKRSILRTPHATEITEPSFKPNFDDVDLRLVYSSEYEALHHCVDERTISMAHQLYFWTAAFNEHTINPKYDVTSLGYSGRSGKAAGISTNHGYWIDSFCDVANGDRMHIDLRGDIFKCKLSNDPTQKVGNIDDLDSVKYMGYTSSVERKYCPHCPILTFCRGICGKYTQEDLDRSCRQKYAKYYASMQTAFELMFDCKLLAVESDDKENEVPVSKLINFKPADYINDRAAWDENASKRITIFPEQDIKKLKKLVEQTKTAEKNGNELYDDV